MPGRKTHEQQIRMFERKDDLPKENELAVPETSLPHGPRHPEARQSEMAVSRNGMNQASRHHKHNDPETGG
jgi:hypothetical protein